jgi:hypothetical protein
MIVQGGVPVWYYDAPPANMLAASNPSFERGTEGWDYQNLSATPSTSWGYESAHSVQVTRNGGAGEVSVGSNYVYVTPGTTYSARISAITATPLTGPKMKLEWFNDTNSEPISSAPSNTVGSGYGVMFVTATAPAGATRARLKFLDTGSGNFSAQLDGAMIVEGGVPTSFYANTPPNLLSAMDPSFEAATTAGLSTRPLMSCPASIPTRAVRPCK